MGVGVSVFLIAVGAILAFAVDVSSGGVDLSAIGVILMIVGAVGLLADFVIFGSGRPFGRRTTVVSDRSSVVTDPEPEVVEYVDEVPVSRRRVVRRRRDVV